MVLFALLAALAATDGAPEPAAAPQTPPPAQPQVADAAPDAGADAAAPANSFRYLSRFGIDRPTCKEGDGCWATESDVLVGAGGSNFGGFGLGFDLHFAALDAQGILSRGKGELDLWGHFNGLGTQSPTAGHPPMGELGAAGELGWGYVGANGIGSGSGLLLLVDALSVNAGVFDGATLVAYTPNVEVGFLAHSTALSTGLQVSFHAGGNAFYGDGPLLHLGATGATASSAFDPYFAAELRLDLPLSPTAMLRLGAELSLTPDWLMPGMERNLWWGHLEALVRFGPLITGPMFTFFAPEKQLGPGNTVTGATPETSFLWMLGF